LVKAGKAKSIGVSNYCKSSLECLFEMEDEDFITPVMNQVQYHVGMGPDPEGIVSYSSSKNILTQAYDPLGMRYHNNTDLINGTLVTDIGQAHGKAGTSVALKWII
jgi:diketogulonate reductase-like aldo/keto reductase